MRKIFLFSVAIIGAIQLTAQKSFKRNTVYGEIGGNGLFLSANYEKQLSDKPGLGLHFGIGLGNSKPTFPLGARYLVGKKRSLLEVGAGVTVAERYSWETLYDYTQAKTNSYSIGFIPSIGYRYQAPKGFMWRLIYTPVFNKYRTELLFLGVSLGWRI